MSKSKSRQPSRQASAASKSGSSGSASKPTAKVSVADAPESAEQETLTAITVEEEVSEETSTEEVVSEKKEASVTTTAKTTADKAVTKKIADEVAEKKESSVAKTAKAAPTKVAAKAVPNTPPLRPIPSTPAGIGGKTQSRDAAKYERRQAERQMRYMAERRRRRNRLVTVLSIILVIAVLAAGGYFLVYLPYFTGAATVKAPQGSFQEPIFNTNYPPVESVYCDQLEQSIEHIHVYVAIYINGKASPLPANVGIPQDSSGNPTCYYWLHTHDTSGVVHIESPSSEAFTFGQFRDEWDQQFVNLGFAPELLLTTGWTIWVNGQKYNGSLSSIPLAAHNIITIAYNSPNVKPVTTYNWGGL